LKTFLSFFKLFPPELSHAIALNSLKLLHKIKLLNLFFSKIKNNNYQLLGLKFTNRLGTAAGLDKNGDFIDCLGDLGFGFLEVGTVTPLPQPGNPKPRVFRLFKENAVINRLGFNNKGVDYLVKNLKRRKYKGIVGVNIGANKNSKGEQRIDDYITCFNKVAKYSDYITINISSPNTPELRNLHDEENIKNLIDSIEQRATILEFTKPIFIKISPDESIEIVKSIATYIQSSKLSGLIVSNTTINKDMLKNIKFKDYDGGLSGSPLMTRSTELLNSINNEYPDLPIIGVGGVMNKVDFNKKLESGASLVQVYTGFIINGPKIVKNILN
jgi:dihydroorotate dehydrogenase